MLELQVKLKGQKAECLVKRFCRALLVRLPSELLGE